MVFGPHAFAVMNQETLDAGWYQIVVHVLECAVGLMIGTELVWNKIKRSGKSIVITTLTQSLEHFLLSRWYSAWYSIYRIFWSIWRLFWRNRVGDCAGAALSIVREFNTKGPVTGTLIPMAALDDIVGCIVFFTTIAIVAGNLSSGELPTYMIALVVILPLIIGAVTGFFAGMLLKRE